MRPRMIRLTLAALVAGCAAASPAVASSPHAGQVCDQKRTPPKGFTCVKQKDGRHRLVARRPAAPPAPPPVPVQPLPVAGPPTGPFTLTSPAFAAGGPLPIAYTCDAPFVSPPLSWTGVPAGTVSLALLLEDLDGAGGPFTQWIAYNVPWQPGQLGEGPTILGVVLGRNDTGSDRYLPPCPPQGAGPHHYLFHVYALSGLEGFESPPARTGFLANIRGVTLGEADVGVTYSR
jgi:Raf kinase inhibitor-like YbhB/YbcL family protein